MFRRTTLIGLLVLGLILSFGAAQDKRYSADRFESNATVASDGSLSVTESVTFRFQGGPFSYVFRELPTENTDGIVDIVAGVDGQPWPQGTEPGQVEITGRNPIRIEWHLPPTADAVRTFDLSYRMLGVVRQGESADILRWQPLPDDYDYPIAEGRFRVSYPDSAIQLGEPAIVNGRADTSFDEGRVNFAVNNLEANEPLIVEIAFQPGTLISAPPAWQAQRAEQNEGRWAWIGSAIAALGACLVGLVALLRSSSPRTAIPEPGTEYLTVPPGKLAPAIAGALQAGASSPSWVHALGTLFDLAQQGALTIEEIPAGKWYESRDFEIFRASPTADLRPHEFAMVDILFTDKHGNPQESILLSKLGGMVTSSRWDRFKDAVRDELKDAGFVDRERVTKQHTVLVGGILLTVLSLGLMLPAALSIQRFGPWTLLPALALFIAGVIWMIASATVRPLSDLGLAVAAEWEPFHRYIKDAARGKIPVQDPGSFEGLLPYATAYGQGEGWVKRFDKLGYGDVPSYFHAVSTDDGTQMAIFAVLIANSASSGGSAGGAAAAGAAGAAGGGSSGAG